MTDRLCTYPGQRQEALIAYVYEDMSASEQSVFESHLAGCETCRAELAALGSVRTRLADWAPPEPTRALVRSETPERQRPRVWAVLEGMPVWAQVAAAVLVLGVSAGAANLQITYNDAGFSVRTGWSGPVDAAVQTALGPGSGGAGPLVADATPPAVAPAATRAELVALERELRADIVKAQTIGPSVVREARALVEASERRQENELALRIGAMAQDVRAQREADNATLTRILGSFRTSADREARLTRDTVQSLAVRVSSQTQQR